MISILVGKLEFLIRLSIIFKMVILMLCLFFFLSVERIRLSLFFLLFFFIVIFWWRMGFLSLVMRLLIVSIFFFGIFQLCVFWGWVLIVRILGMMGRCIRGCQNGVRQLVWCLVCCWWCLFVVCWFCCFIRRRGGKQ